MAAIQATRPKDVSNLPVTALECARTRRTRPVHFDSATIIHVLEGSIRVETAEGGYDLTPGMTLSLGAGRWCTVAPQPSVRMWTLHVNEDFLRNHLTWVLPDSHRLHHWVQSDHWDGSVIVSSPGVEFMHLVEPIWRQISIMDPKATPELRTTRLITLFTRAMELSLPTLLSDDEVAAPQDFPLTGALAEMPIGRQVRDAISALRSRLSETWSVQKLAAEVSMSRAHLTRLFTTQVGVAPMRLLAEIRLTEFARLIEETDLSVSGAAHRVGWEDGRVAAGWFRRRFGVSPSTYRQLRHTDE